MKEAEVIEILKNQLGFSNCSIKKLKKFQNYLLKYNKSYNLISKKTEETVWDRHILDSAQITKFIGESKVNKIVGDDYKKLNDPKDKHSRYGDISDYKYEIAEKFEEDYPDDLGTVKNHVDELINSGLIKGGSTETALVCDADAWVNPPLRFEDEPVRHKLLDLIGDLALAGLPKAQVLVYRGSHGLHTDLAVSLLKNNCLFR